MTSLCENTALRGGWFAVALAGDVGVDPLGVTLLGSRFVVWRGVDGDLAAAPDRCLHREAPLSAGTVQEGVITCAYHGWAFNTEGHCVAVPSSSDPSQVPRRSHLTMCAVRVAHGLVWLCPAGEATTPFPEIREDADSTYRRFNGPMQYWRTAATRMIDNSLDRAHFAYVHAASIGKGIDPVVARHDVIKLDDCFTGCSYEEEIGNPEEARTTHGDDRETTTIRASVGFCLPFTFRQVMEYANGVRQVMMIINTPVDDDNSLFSFVIWRSDDAPGEELINFELEIDAEDQQMLEMISGPLPLERGALVSVSSDKASERWRRELVKLLDGQPVCNPSPAGEHAAVSSA
jgi:phenylpropionate dioxygenase-like ring-hydroxylating dioxygenase large terminal subunit